MIGIEENTVLNFEGKVTGAILNKHWYGMRPPEQIIPFTPTLTERIVIKDVEVLNPGQSYPQAMVKVIFIMNKAGNLVIPKKRSSVLGFLNTSNKYYIVFGLSHVDGSSEVNLYAEFRKRTNEGIKTRYDLMYWESTDFNSYKDWDVQFHAINMWITDQEEKIIHVCAIDDGTDLYDIRLQVAADASTSRSLTLFKDRIMEVPETKEGLGAFYDTASQLYTIENGKMFDQIHSPSYVNGVPDTSDSVSEIETQVSGMQSQIGEINEKVNAVAVSTTSRFVSR